MGCRTPEGSGSGGGHRQQKAKPRLLFRHEGQIGDVTQFIARLGLAEGCGHLAPHNRSSALPGIHP
jgi:hypothetical protein